MYYSQVYITAKCPFFENARQAAFIEIYNLKYYSADEQSRWIEL